MVVHLIMMELLDKTSRNTVHIVSDMPAPNIPLLINEVFIITTVQSIVFSSDGWVTTVTSNIQLTHSFE